MKLKIILLLQLIIFLILSCDEKKEVELCPDFKLEEATLIDILDYELINIIFDSIYSNTNYIHVLQKTNSNININELKIKLKDRNIEIDTLLLLNYETQNNHSYFFNNKFQENVELLSNDEFNCFFEDTNPYSSWENYYKKYKYSNGQYTFKRPGFNSNKNKAIIEYSWMAGADKGESYIVILEKINNKWKIIHHFVTWVS